MSREYVEKVMEGQGIDPKNYRHLSEEALNKYVDLVDNVLSSRTNLIQGMMDPRRDIDKECGYPGIHYPITVESYHELYRREGIAKRVVDVLPTESWQVQPEVYEDERPDVTTPFEEAWSALHTSLRGESYYRGNVGSPIWNTLLTLDILSGIGQYGVLLLGFDDSKDLNKPVRQQQGRKLAYLRAYPEIQATIAAYDTDMSSPRFGQPTSYAITHANPAQTQLMDSTVTYLPTVSQTVHWTRVIHVADNTTMGSSVFGIPRQEPVYNRLLDLRKSYGGSAEMHWKGAFPGLSFETHPTLGGDVKIDGDSLRDQIENYHNGLQRAFQLTGMSVKSLSPQVADPQPLIKILLEAITIEIGVPMRVFKGSERGELASVQDDDAWNDRLAHRENNHITPNIICPLVDRLIWAGCLPVPKGYYVSWPDLESLGQKDKSDIAYKRTNALYLYVKGQIYLVMSLTSFLTMIMGFTDAEANTVAQEEPDIARFGQVSQGGGQAAPDPAEAKNTITKILAQNQEYRTVLENNPGMDIMKVETVTKDMQGRIVEVRHHYEPILAGA